MPARLRPLEPADLPRVVDLSLRAWEPVFTSLRTVLGDEVFQRLYRTDWRSDQERAVTATCTSMRMRATVADEAGAVGFVTFAADPATRLGVIEMLAVDPNRQGAGIGTALTSFALRALRDAGMRGHGRRGRVRASV